MKKVTIKKKEKANYSQQMILKQLNICAKTNKNKAKPSNLYLPLSTKN